MVRLPWRKRADDPGGPDPEFAKVRFSLEPDEDGYPPSAAEWVWTSPTGDGRFRLENIPWYAVGVAIGDVVEVREEEGVREFERVVERSGHSTLRVVLFDPENTQPLRDELLELGCESELSHLPGFIAVDVPLDTDMQPVLALLRTGESEQRWEFETGHVGDPHVAAFSD